MYLYQYLELKAASTSTSTLDLYSSTSTSTKYYISGHHPTFARIVPEIHANQANLYEAGCIGLGHICSLTRQSQNAVNLLLPWAAKRWELFSFSGVGFSLTSDSDQGLCPSIPLGAPPQTPV